jgi:hypothetical protein
MVGEKVQRENPGKVRHFIYGGSKSIILEGSQTYPRVLLIGVE